MRKLFSFVLCLAMLLPVALGSMPTAVAEGLDGDDYCADIAEYRSGTQDTWTYPTKEGYVFAGWYQNEARTVAVAEETVSGGAYAKFVDENVLSVKYQMNALANLADDTMSLRMLTSVDSLSYQRVGFHFQAGMSSVDFMSTTVYTSVRANDQTVAPSVFSAASNYILGHSLNSIPKNSYGSTFTVTPVWVTLDGTTVSGVARQITIRDDYKVAEDKTLAWNGWRVDYWFSNIKINANQWVSFDLEGFNVGDAGSVYFMINSGSTTVEAFNNAHAGSRYYVVSEGDKMRFYGQIYGDYANNSVGIRVFESGYEGYTTDNMITVSNLRVTDEPDRAFFCNFDCSSSSNYYQPSGWMGVTASAGQYLTYKVSLEQGNLLNHMGSNDPKSWIRVNQSDASADVLNSTSVVDNGDGSQTVQVLLTKDITSFKPTFSLQNLPGETVANKIVISDIQVNDGANKYYTGSSQRPQFTWPGVNVQAGDILSFDIEADTMGITAQLQKPVDGMANWQKNLLNGGNTKGKITVTHTLTGSSADIGMIVTDAANWWGYPVVRVTNMKITRAS